MTNKTLAMNLEKEANPATRNLEKEANPLERELGGRTLGGLVGILDNHANANEGNPFALTYESEMIVPVEVGMPNYRVQHFDQDFNNKKLEEHLYFLEERREEAKVQATINKREGMTTQRKGSWVLSGNDHMW